MVEGYPGPWNGILARLIKREGGYTNDPIDVGGSTKFGVTAATWADYCQETGRAWCHVSQITEADAAAVYWRNYVGHPNLRLDEIERAPTLLELALDTACLFGPDRAGRWLQEAVNTVRPKSKLAVDGRIGPKTREALAACKVGPVAAQIVAARVRHHVDRCIKRPDQIRFLRGWTNRALEWLGKTVR